MKNVVSVFFLPFCQAKRAKHPHPDLRGEFWWAQAWVAQKNFQDHPRFTLLPVHDTLPIRGVVSLQNTGIANIFPNSHDISYLTQ